MHIDDRTKLLRHQALVIILSTQQCSSEGNEPLTFTVEMFYQKLFVFRIRLFSWSWCSDYYLHTSKVARFFLVEVFETGFRWEPAGPSRSSQYCTQMHLRQGPESHVTETHFCFWQALPCTCIIQAVACTVLTLWMRFEYWCVQFHNV